MALMVNSIVKLLPSLSDIKDYREELKANGYFLSQGKELKDIKLEIG